MYEKFNKLRTVMCELTNKFKEIDFEKKQAKRDVPAFNDVDTSNDFNFKTLPQANLEKSKNVIKDCKIHFQN